MARPDGNNPMRSGPLWDAVRRALEDAGLGDLPEGPPDISEALGASPQELIAAARQENPSLIDRLASILSPALFPDKGQRQALMGAMIRHLRPDLVRNLRGGGSGEKAPGGSDTPAVPPPPVPAAGRPSTDWNAVYTVTPTTIVNNTIESLRESSGASSTAQVPGSSVINAAAASGATSVEPERRRTAREVFRQIGQSIHQRLRPGASVDAPAPSAARLTPATVQPAESVTPPAQPAGVFGRFMAGMGRGFGFVPRLAAGGLRRALQSVVYRSMIHPTLAQHVHGLWRIEQAARHAEHGQPHTTPRPMTAASPLLQAMTATPTPHENDVATLTPQAAATTDALSLPAAPAAMANVQTSRPVAPRRSGLIMGNVSRSLRNAVRPQEARQPVEAVNTSRQSVDKPAEQRHEQPARPSLMQRIGGTTVGRTMVNMLRTVVTQGRRQTRQLSRSLDPRATGGMVHRWTSAIRNQLRPQAPASPTASIAARQAARAQSRSLLRSVSRTGTGRRLLSGGRRAGVMLRRRARQAFGRRVAGRVAGRAAGGLMGRMGAGLAGRLGLGAAAGGGAAAAGGLGVAGIAGVAVGLAAFGGILALAVMPALKKFAEHLNEGNRELARYNGTIAAAFLRLDMGRVYREQAMGNETAGSASSLADAVNELEEAFHPMATSMRSVGNQIAIGAAYIATKIAEVNNALLKHLPGMEWLLEKIEDNQKDKEKSAQFAWKLLHTLKDPARDQRLNGPGLQQRQPIDPLWKG